MPAQGREQTEEGSGYHSALSDGGQPESQGPTADADDPQFRSDGMAIRFNVGR